MCISKRRKIDRCSKWCISSFTPPPSIAQLQTSIPTKNGRLAKWLQCHVRRSNKPPNLRVLYSGMNRVYGFPCCSKMQNHEQLILKNTHINEWLHDTILKGEQHLSPQRKTHLSVPLYMSNHATIRTHEFPNNIGIRSEDI